MSYLEVQERKAMVSMMVALVLEPFPCKPYIVAREKEITSIDGLNKGDMCDSS